ncbi:MULTISPECIES: biotin--[acetyl-CoA-carboxylase] ligase [Halorussus]|uniref:biotin--[acetyl-CoA-carboxylase] ligase n=1 Tax=Halorussus TaxID=1070314 RepID=UPI00209CBA52|nr:biotin--[acetyl-CoA-carboxylase] ligase [Halorussus vallis]USZ76741.1 biotin--[acetyl-CoA-carboxylase] ligase [Halorussus vallis]
MNDTRRAVLAALADGPVTGPALADRLGISRNAVWKHVEALRNAGFEVESGADGYALAAVPEYGEAAVEFGLDAPFDVEYHDSVDSTNARARELAVASAGDVAVLADEQTGGRGRLDREWSSPRGGVWCSLVLRPALPPARVPLLTLAAAVAVADAAREAGVPAEIKWPNDVLVSGPNEGSSDLRSDGVLVGDTGERGGRKLAGVLTEMEGEADSVSWVVVGIGVNANLDAEALPDGATSLRAERRARRSARSESDGEHEDDVDRRIFVQRLLERFDELRGDPDSILDAWRERSATLGQRVRVETADGAVVGEAVDVVSPGALVVETDDGEEVWVLAGDCEHLRPA